jgi:8-oxo-dGTP pyrophosphatase MutT (NUDIX family)
VTKHNLLALLAAHVPHDANEHEMCRRLTQFVGDHDDCFERSLRIGHVTGSAWVLDTLYSHVLLTHHGKLDKWLQLGGHADGEPDVLRVAMREAMEESGLTDIRPATESIFDVDIHLIPACGGEPEHFHYDVRFLFTADRTEPLNLTNESKALAWVVLEQVGQLTREESILRMVRKTLGLRHSRNHG